MLLHFLKKISLRLFLKTIKKLKCQMSKAAQDTPFYITFPFYKLVISNENVLTNN